MDLRDIEAILPPGFRFYPSDEELVCHYLYKRVLNERPPKGTMVDIDLHICEPWQLPDVAKLGSNEWYFFSFRDRKYATGSRTNRATTYGYWKATGKDRPVFDSSTNAIVGMRKTLVFYRERAPHGIKTGWVMHEFRLENPHTTLNPKDAWVLCRVFNKSKGEPTSFSLQNERGDTGYSSPNPDSIDQSIRERQEQFITLFSSVPHQRHNNGSSSSLDVPLSPYNFLDETPTIGLNYNTEDGCGYLLDIGTEDENLENGGRPDLEDTRFQGVNKSVFKFGQ